MGKTADLPAKSTGNPSSTICAAAFKPVGEYRLRPAAEQDLREIWSYGTERWSHDQAERYLNILFDKFEEIAAFPDSGEDVSWIKNDYRRRRVCVHLVFYRKLDLAIIDIIRVFHERMDVEGQLE
ncbi:type II toxin-antitoxin system RelE/ParE family toxin [Agrobacterium vitis]